jgi:hypothetical protein
MKINTLAVLALGAAFLAVSPMAHAAEPSTLSILSAYGITAGDLVSTQTWNLPGTVIFTKIDPTSMDTSNPGFTAADAPYTSFGYYAAGNASAKTQLWPEDLTATSVTLTPSSSPFGLYIDNERLNPPTGATIGGVPGPFYTETSLNSDGDQHADVYQLNSGTWFVAFEDRSFDPGKLGRTADGDFNDLIVEVQDPALVPETNGAALMAIGTLGMGALQLLRLRRRTARRSA